MVVAGPGTVGRGAASQGTPWYGKVWTPSPSLTSSLVGMGVARFGRVRSALLGLAEARYGFSLLPRRGWSRQGWLSQGPVSLGKAGVSSSASAGLGQARYGTARFAKARLGRLARASQGQVGPGSPFTVWSGVVRRAGSGCRQVGLAEVGPHGNLPAFQDASAVLEWRGFIPGGI